MNLREPHGTRLGLPFALSAMAHGSFAAIVLWAARSAPPPVLPPIYRVNIVAAPAGLRAIGEVRTEKSPTVPEAQPRPVADVEPKRMPSPERAPAAREIRRATPAPATRKKNTPAPKAGGGPIGGKGADVATVQTEGIEFPFPGYLNNIVRQIALRFEPPDKDARLRAEIMFLIRRDGSVTGIRFITRSGAYHFDLEAHGAVEAAAAAHAFGPLPDGFADDVLPVSFSFDPQILR